MLASVGWVAMRGPARAGEQAMAKASAADTAKPAEQFLLLTTGQLIPGIVAQEGSNYSVTQRIGVIPFPKKQVEGVFASAHDAYKYKLDQVPDDDVDEHMKLALLCMSWKLKADAKDELAKVLVLNAKHPQAKAMLASIQQAEMIADQRQRDPEVKQTKGDRNAGERPGALDSAVIEGAQRQRMILPNPVIFDLPVPTAIVLANEFYRFVHPVLQSHCVRCHDGQYEGEFQLVPIKSKLDRTPDALRANLDATLRLIDPENPLKSELLTSTLRPHGTGVRPRPIFPGSNDRVYQILATWANNLRSSRTRMKQELSPTVRQGSGGRDAEPFAADRERIGRDPADRAVADNDASASRKPSRMAAEEPEPNVIPPPLRYRGNLDLSTRQDNPDPREIEFPIPPSLDGFKTPLPTQKNAAKKPMENQAKTAARPPAAIANGARTPAPAGRAAAPASRGASPSAGTAQEKQVSADDPDTPKKPVKPVKIDAKYLDMMLQRNIGR
jgi:hypothetical protein